MGRVRQQSTESVSWALVYQTKWAMERVINFMREPLVTRSTLVKVSGSNCLVVSDPFVNEESPPLIMSSIFFSMRFVRLPFLKRVEVGVGKLLVIVDEAANLSFSF